ncbi:MAG TPA: TAXI family TRAP transporter solute-binding subunit [Vicinamibacterales bacterium]|nr:TAXI family TRAP transporter solute-binding subunit [Vicinamibacterales bacterium]
MRRPLESPPPDVRRRARRASLWCCIVAALLAAGCGEAPARAAATRPTVRMATGLPGASFRPLTTGILKGLRAQLPAIDFVAIDTPGSNTNLEHIQSGAADIGLAYSDGAYRVYIDELRGGRHRDAARAIAVLHPASVHVLVRAASAIRSIADLKGLRIAAGAAGTGTASISETLLRFFDVTPQRELLQALSFEDSVDALMHGRVDAAFIISSDPVDSIRLATDGGARLVEISGDTVDELLTEYPFFRRSVIPSLTYPRQQAPVVTVGVDTLLVCRRELDDDIVRSVTAAFFRILPDLAAEFDALQSVDLDRAPAAPVPLHPGAALFYRESELAR